MTLLTMQGSRRRTVIQARQELDRRVDETPPPVSVLAEPSIEPPPKRGGRPKGSKNKPKPAAEAVGL